MTLPAQVTKEAHSKLDLLLQKEYRALDDGSFRLDVSPFESNGVLIALEDVGGLKRTVQTTRSERDQFAERLRGFEGLDPEVARKDRKKVEAFETEKPDEKAERRIKLAEEKFNGELATRDQANAALSREIDEIVLEHAATKALAKHGIEDPEILLPHLIRQGKTVKDARGKRVAVIVDERGEPLPTKRGTSMDPMGFEERVEGLRKETRYAPYFPSNGATGSGAGGPKGGAGSSERTQRTSSDTNPTSPVEKLKAHRRQPA